jgi:dephospho-CoA kinase
VLRTIVCLAGGIASGKTTVAQALIGALPNCSARSFGDVVRRYAQAAGLPLARATLQDTGVRLIVEGWPRFVDELLSELPPDADVLIVDGVRHVEVVDELRGRFPGAALRLIFLYADDATAHARLTERGDDPDALRHRVESSLLQIAEIADLRIESTCPPEEIAQAIRESVAGPRGSTGRRS